jgi:hypothetical protein
MSGLATISSNAFTPKAYNFNKNQEYHVPDSRYIPKCVMKYLLDKQKGVISTCESPKNWIVTYQLRTGEDLAPWLLSYGYDISKNMTGSTAKYKKSRRSRKHKKSLRKTRRV